MKESMDINRDTWIATVKLALVISAIAACAAVAVSTLGQISDVAIVATVAVVAFAVSWVQTGRLRSTPMPMPMPLPLPERTPVHAR